VVEFLLHFSLFPMYKFSKRHLHALKKAILTTNNEQELEHVEMLL